MIPDWSGKPDNELMAALSAGDEAAFEELVRRWGPRLRRFFRGFRGSGISPADAEELAHEVWVRIWKSAATYDSSRPFAHWFFTVARNELRQAWRRSSHRSRLSRPRSLESLDEEPAAKPPAPEIDWSDELDHYLRLLTEQERAFLLLWEKGLGDLSQTEVAKILGVSNSTVTRIKEAALRKLSNALKAKEDRRGS
jgi:RNA polymerase sigma-70 factor, ECF subfamily